MPRDLSTLNLSQFSAFLFDLDGTLIDGSDRHFVQSVALTGEEFGFQDFIIPPGHGLTAFLRQMISDADEAFIERFKKRNREIMEQLPRPVQFHDDALNFIKLYQDTPRAIVTNCSDWELRFTEEMLDLRSLFPVLIFKTPEIPSKPAGEMYLHAARTLQTDPHKCLVFEDSATGIRAGKNANMTVVGIDRNTHRDFDLADYVVKSFKELVGNAERRMKN